jgi:hypothetical protein
MIGRKYMYGLKESPLVSQLRDLTKNNEERFQSRKVKLVEHIEELLNIQHRIASHHLRWFVDPASPIKRHKELNPLLFSTFHKNLLFIFSALELSRKGLHGVAMNLQRNVFEGLVISKYCNICRDYHILERRADMKPIYLTQQVFDKIVSPDPAPLKKYWGVLCDYAHPTKTSGQVWVDLRDDGVLESLIFSLITLNVLLICNYHLLTRQMIDNRMEYEASIYTPSFTGTPYEMPRLKSRAHEIFREMKTTFKQPTVSLIYTYRREWTLK